MNDTVEFVWTVERLREYRKQILALADQYGVTNIRVFGSVARGEATENSDIDLLVTYKEGTSLWDAIGLWQDLQEILNCSVSLVSEDDRPQRQRFIDRIQEDAIPL